MDTGGEAGLATCRAASDWRLLAAGGKVSFAFVCTGLVAGKSTGEHTREGAVVKSAGSRLRVHLPCPPAEANSQMHFCLSLSQPRLLISLKLVCRRCCSKWR